MKTPALFLVLLLLVPAIWAQNRVALVIGNENYPRADDKLPNAINDTYDISKELKDLGFEDVTLRQNLNFVDMFREINAFISKLARNRNSEGFFWYGGHAVEIGGKNYLMPLDVNTEDEDLTIATSYSVTTLLERLEGVRNKVNIVVLDACRVPPLIGGDGRGRGDTSRLIKAVPQVPPDVLVIYSTASGARAFDGEGKRNSPFTEAFKKYMKSTEPLTQMVSHVITETMSLTSQRQRPYTSGSMGSENAYYSLNPSGSVPSPGYTLNPNPPTAQSAAKDHFDKGQIFFDRNDYDTAILEFTEAIKLDPNFSDAYAYRARAYNGKQDYDHALADSSTAMRLNPNNAIAYYARGNTYLNKNDYDRAIADYTQAIRIDPNYILAYNNRANAYRNKNDYERAIADYTQAIRIDPNYILAYNNRGIAYQDGKNDYERAIADYTEALRLDPNYALAYLNRGNAYRSKNDHERAIADYTQAIRLDPNYVLAYNNRGYAYQYGMKNYDRAIADYTQAIRIDPNFTSAYNNRGIAYLDGKNDYDRAIADYTEALRLDPNYALAYLNRGNAYRSKNDYERAIADYTNALRLDPNYVLAYNNRGYAYQYGMKNYDRAIADYTQAIRIDPNFTSAYNNRANAYLDGKNDYDRAIADYTEALRLDPDYALAYNNRGLAYQKKGDTAKANADFAKAKELGYR